MNSEYTRMTEMAAQKSLTSMTKITLCGNWLHLVWTYFHQGIENCFETVPNL